MYNTTTSHQATDSPTRIYIQLEPATSAQTARNRTNPNMTATTAKPPDTPSFQQPLLPHEQPPPPPPQTQYVVVLPPYPHPHRHRLLRRSCRRSLSSAAILILFLVAAAYLLWPSHPKLSVVRLRLERLRFHTRPKISLDATLDLTVRIRNVDFYAVDYDSLVVAIEYRGTRLGLVTSDGGYVEARGTSYVNATLRLDGVEVLSDVVALLEDLAKGVIVFDTVSEISGRLRVFFFDLPLKTKTSCEAVVNTREQTISRQSCYPEVTQVR